MKDDVELARNLNAGIDEPQQRGKRNSMIRRRSSLFGMKSVQNNFLIGLDAPRSTAPLPMRISAIFRRREVIIEILWLLWGLHGKASGSSRHSAAKKGLVIGPEDRYETLADYIDMERA
jgi:hypothetical protein